MQLFPVNSECLVVACHDRAANESLPFVHTARRYDRWHVGAKRPEAAPSRRCQRQLSLGVMRS